MPILSQLKGEHNLKLDRDNLYKPAETDINVKRRRGPW